jgi:hypothetical protein
LARGKDHKAPESMEEAEGHRFDRGEGSGDGTVAPRIGNTRLPVP